MSLIHWWPLNGDTNDYGTNNLNGTLIDSTSFDNSGKIGKCLLADTGSLYSGRGVDIPSNLVSELSEKDYSFAAWVKPNGNHVHYEGAIISSGNWNSSCWAFGLNSSNTAINPAGNWYNTAYVSYTFTIGQWYHIVSVQKNGTNYVYVNGALVGTVSHGAISQSDASDTCIGRETYAGGYFGFNGCINDVRIYDHALSAKEVKEISKGLVLHYDFNDPYAEGTTNYVPNPTTFSNWSSYDHGYTSIVDCELGGKKVIIDNILSWCGIHVTLNLPSAGTYTISAWCKPISRTSSSIRQTVYTSGGGIGDTDASAVWTNLGTWQRVSMTRTYTTTSIHLYLIAYGGDGSGRISCEYSMPQIEAKDHATPFVNGTRSAGTVFDCSGYNNNGTVTGNPQIVDANGGSGKYCFKFDGSTLIKSADLTSEGRTASFWYKGALPGTKVIFADSGSKLAAGFYYNSFIVSSQADEQPYFSLSNYSETSWNHFVIIRGTSTNTSKLYLNGVEQTIAGYNEWWTHSGGIWLGGRSATADSNITGSIADFKIYSTVLSASDILAEYNRKASIDKSGILFTGEFVESSLINLMQITSYGIATQTWSSGLSNYTQTNCRVSLTKDGLRIYRTPNHDGRSQEGSGWDNWGGMRLTPLSIDPNLLQKGHSYILKWHVKGQTCDSIDPYFTNQMGWGGGGLDPNPSNVEKTYLPAGFIGEKDCYYKFTINDDVYKVCTVSYSGFVQGETYPSYRDFAFGASYSITNDLGTDLYITNIRLYDITNLTEQQIKILKTNIITCEDFYEGPDINVRFEKSGTISVKSLKEI